MRLQAARRPRSPPTCGRTPPRWPRRCSSRCSAPGQPDLTAAAEAVARRRLGHARCRPWPRWPGASGGTRGPERSRGAGVEPGRARCAACSPAARSATRRWSSPASGSAAIRSNIPLRPRLALRPALPRRRATSMIDFGDDELTAGRPHPMIDPTLRLERLAAEAADPATAVLLLDVVLGHGAHPDPAAELAPGDRGAAPARDGRSCRRRLADRHRRRPAGTGPRRPTALAAAGAHVFAVQRAATRLALRPGRSVTHAPRPAARAARGASPRGRSPPASRCSPTRCARRPCAVTPGRLAAADGRHRGRPRAGRWPTRAAPRPTPWPCERMLAVRAHLVDVVPAGEALGPASPASSCTPGRRSSGTGPRARCAARSSARCSSRGWPTTAEDAGGRWSAAAAFSLEPCHHRGAVGPDGRRGLAVDVGLRARATRRPGSASCCSLNEGLGKVLRYGAYGPEVIDRLRWMSAVLGPLLQAAVRAARAGRRHRDHRPDAADGRRGAQPQPGRHADAAARPAAGDDRVRGSAPADVAEAARVHRRQRPLLPQPRDAGLQARARRRRATSPARPMVVAMARNGTDFGIQVSGTGDAVVHRPRR